MKNIYYAIWVDAITASRKKNPQETNWKLRNLTLISWCNALNLWTIVSWLKFYGINFELIKINFLVGSRLGSFISFFINFALVFFIINYFFIFYRNRYESLIKKYDSKNGILAFGYGAVSCVIFLTTAFMYLVFT